MLFLKPKPPIDADEFDWLIACFAWLQGVVPGGLAESKLVLPDERSFPPVHAQGHDLATALFERTRELCGMTEWPCRLVAGEQRRDGRVQAGFALQHEDHLPAGTFSVQGDEAIVTYDPGLLAAPATLVATFAHELAHYLLATAGDPPGGEELHEHATDCAGVFLGFGILLANSSFQYAQFSDSVEAGWERRSLGYLSELAIVTATALFVHFVAADAGEAERALKPYLRKPFRKALKAVVHRFPNGVAALAKVDLADWTA